MSQHQDQQIQQIFDVNNKYVKKAWQKVNPKNKKKQITTAELQSFMKDVMQNSKQELGMEIDQDTNFMEMIEAYKQEIQEPNKDKFYLAEAVEVLNFALSGAEEEEEGEEQQEEQQQQENQKVNDKTKNQPDQKVQQKAKTEVKKDEKVEKQPQTKQKQTTPQKKQSQKPAVETQNKNPQKAKIQQNQQTKQSKQIKQSKQTQSQIHKKSQKDHEKEHEEQKGQQKDQKNHKSALNQSRRQQDEQLKKSDIKENVNKQIQKHKNYQSKGHKLQQNKRSQRQSTNMNWGNNSKKMDQEINKKLYKEINSYSTQEPIKMNKKQRNSVKREVQYEESDRIQEGSMNTIKAPQGETLMRCPLSIKKSLAKLNAKTKYKAAQKPIIPVLSISADAPQMKYIKKLKLKIKNKKPKAPFHPEQNGLKELFKFYCSLHSEMYNVSKHKDPAKGTFDQLQKRSTQLYMHNFMLFCKDFKLIESKLPSNPTYNKSRVEEVDRTIQKQNQKPVVNQKSTKRRSSKGSVPQSTHKKQQTKEKQTKNKEKKKLQVPKIVPPIERDMWDRDKISNYFKKQADYTLNLKYDKFIQIIKTIMENQVSQTMQTMQKREQNQEIQNQAEQEVANKASSKNHQENQQEQQQNNPNNQRQTSQNNLAQSKMTKTIQKQSKQETKQNKNSINVQPQKMALCIIFQVQTQQKFQKTLKRLKIIHKIMEPQPSTQRQKKNFKALNGQFQQNIAESIKNRQLERQKHNIELKQKYLNKFNLKQIDSYSSFKKATNPTNNMNGLYGSGPKLNQSRTTQNLNSMPNNSMLYESAGQYTGMRKKHSRHDALELGSVIKQARNQIYDGTGNKQKKRKQASKTQKIEKNRFKPLTVNTAALNSNLLNPSIGYKKLHDLKNQGQNESLSSILMNNSRIAQHGDITNRSKVKSKSKDIHSPLLQRMGCHEDDDVLNKFFDQEKSIEKSQVLVNYLR